MVSQTKKADGQNTDTSLLHVHLMHFEKCMKGYKESNYQHNPKKGGNDYNKEVFKHRV
jgi:hypothetical protein